MDIVDQYKYLVRCYTSLIEEYKMIPDPNSSRARFCKRQIETCEQKMKDIERFVANNSVGNYKQN